MRKFIPLIVLITTLLGCEQKQSQENSTDQRIITAGGTVTEIVHALGMSSHIIATDITSTYPAEMQALPSIGYRNQIKTEGILSLNPDWVIAEKGYLNDDVITQLNEVSLSVSNLKKPTQLSETKALISELGKLLNRQKEADSLLNLLQADIENLEEQTGQSVLLPKVAFVMARGPETVFLAGEESFAAGFIRMAGGEFVGLDKVDYKPLSPEALAALNPDFILMFESSLQSMGGISGLSKIVGIEHTTAWEKQQIIGMDGNLISGFGPRIAKAALELHNQINP